VDYNPCVPMAENPQDDMAILIIRTRRRSNPHLLLVLRLKDDFPPRKSRGHELAWTCRCALDGNQLRTLHLAFPYQSAGGWC
jgi:hypothetical protein